MSDFKGTKGPWEVKHSISKPAWNVIGKELGGRYKIARLPYLELEDKELELKENVEQYANARLIAAAPDLFEALSKLKIWVGKLEDWKGEDPPFDMVDKALKKATLTI